MTASFPDGVPVLVDPGRGVHLRPHSPEDLSALVEQCTDPEIIRWTTVPLDYGEQDARDFLARIPGLWAAGKPVWAIEAVRNGTRRYCGSIDLRPEGDGTATVGYALHPGARRQGYASAALRLARDHAFDVLDLQVLRWRAITGNWGSRRTAAAAGFLVDGRVRSLLPHRGRWVDGWMATMLPTDPREPRPWSDPPVLAGNGVRLRPLADRDAVRIAEACSDPRTAHWLVSLPQPYLPVHGAAFVEQSREVAAAGLGWHWAVTGQGEDRLLGSISLEGFHGYARRAEIGYWSHPDARGRGVLTAATRLITDLAESTGLTSSIQIRCAEQNAASRHVAEAAGYRFTGVQHAAEPIGDGRLSDLVIYSRP